MKKDEFGFYPGYGPPHAYSKDGDSLSLTAAERHAQNRLWDAKGCAAEVRSRHPEMQVRKVNAAQQKNGGN